MKTVLHKPWNTKPRGAAIYVWNSKRSGVIELKGPRWECGWTATRGMMPVTRIQRMMFPEDLSEAFEHFLEVLKSHGYYVKSVEVHRNADADKIEAELGKNAGGNRERRGAGEGEGGPASK